MVTIDVSIEDISKLIGLDKTLSVDDLNDLLTLAIAEVDSDPVGPDENGHTKIAIEIKTSNRPDFWSAEGIARVIKGKFGEEGLPDLSVIESKYEINVNPELLTIRPYVAAAVVRGLTFDDFLIKQMIQVQDKLDFSFGRKRKRTSIGIYNINMLESPIEYTVVDRKFKFQPLTFDHDLTVDEIFEKHPKGIEYRHILDDFKKVPMLIDKNGLVLSMPPIINSNDVGRVTTQTTDVLVETTGYSHQATSQALSVIVQTLRDRGGIIESVKINYPDNYDISIDITPETDPIRFDVNIKDINKYLGVNFPGKEMVKLLRMRRIEAKVIKDKLTVLLPPWRKDIIHWVDISEEVAIAADYNSFEPTPVQVITAGKLDKSSDDENLMRQILIGMGLTEVFNYTLTSKEVIGELMNREEKWIDSNCIEISNPVNASYAILRPDLLPLLMKFLSVNTHNEYPQKIFETGECVVKDKKKIGTRLMMSTVLAGSNETFETILRILDRVCVLLGVTYELKNTELNCYIPGRRAIVIIDGIEAGHIGEIHPELIVKNGIEVPISALELD
ncbi:MAG: phenylalanine--tRNA ligase subunit beta, partial [Candidatus Heimdallarchaeota archaeon]|nr:phenylalanine--tRNA ligase subunit beta [Candidatus Heimdallarchaeota archaeon]